MKKGKKIALIALMVVIAIAGTIGGVVMAQSDDEDTTTTQETARLAYLERVCEIYYENTGVTIEASELQEALCQTVEEYREQARNQYLQRLVDEGIITEEQLNEWQEWLADMPDMPDNLTGKIGMGIEHGKRFALGFGYAFGKGFGEGLSDWCQDNNSED